MNALELLNQVTEYAKTYRNDAIESIQRNRHMNEIEKGEAFNQRYVDAVLVDFINFIGGRSGIDYALYASDLKPPVEKAPKEPLTETDREWLLRHIEENKEHYRRVFS